MFYSSALLTSLVRLGHSYNAVCHHDNGVLQKRFVRLSALSACCPGKMRPLILFFLDTSGAKSLARHPLLHPLPFHPAVVRPLSSRPVVQCFV